METRVSTLVIPSQRHTGDPGKDDEVGNRNEGHSNRIERKKTVLICWQQDDLGKSISKNQQKNYLEYEVILMFRGQKVNIKKSIVFLYTFNEN